MSARPHLVFLHNAGMSSRLWDRVIAELGDGWQVSAPDLPGFGATPRMRVIPSLATYTDYFSSYLDGLGDEPVVLVGSCFGATIASEYARRRPERVAGLVLVNALDFETTMGGMFERSFLMARRFPWIPPIMSRAARFIRPPRRLAARTGRRAYADEVDAEFLEVVAGLYGRPDQVPSLVSVWCAETAPEWQVATLKGSGIPTRVTWGADNVVVPAKHAAMIAERVGAPAPTVVPDAAHMLPVQHPSSVANVIRELVATLAG